MKALEELDMDAVETHKEQRRQAILDAAERLFARLEYADVRLDDVAQGALVAKGTLYLYFESKLDLFLSTVERKLNNVHDLLLSALRSTPDPALALRRVIRAELGFLHEDADFFRAYYPQVLNMRVRSGIAADEVRRRILPTMHAIMNAVADTIRAGQDAGVFRRTDPHRLAFLLGAWLREATILSASGVCVDVASLSETLESIFLEGLLVR